MATREWAGPGADDWLVATPVDTDTGVFTNTGQSMTEDFAAIDTVNFAAVYLTPSFYGDIGDESQGFAVECNGDFINRSASGFIHITGGDTENIEDVLHLPRRNGAEMVISNATVGTVVVGATGRATVRGDVTLTTAIVNGNGYLAVLSGSGSTTAFEAYGAGTLDIYEDPTVSGITISDRATVNIMHDDCSVSVNMFGGTLRPRGGELASPTLLGGTLDCSHLQADLTISGSSGEVGPDLRVISPPAPWKINVTGTITFRGDRPEGWPGNYG